MAFVLGIDISTTGAKALVIDDTGRVTASATTEYPLSTPRPLWSEQDPADWWSAIQESIHHVLAEANLGAKDIVGVGLTGQMHGLVLLDAEGNVLRPAILWNDQRTGPQCDYITKKVGKAQLLSWTGNPALTGFTAPKIIWVRDNEPLIYGQIAHVLLPKDYVRYKLTDTYATDMAGAAGTLLLDIKNRDWSVEMLQALGIPQAWLPPCHEGPEITGQVSSTAAKATGLKEATPVVGGGGDQAAQAVGVGAVQPGTIALTLGTSGVVFAPTDEPIIEPEGKLHAFCHALPDHWHMMGVMLSAAGALRWYRDLAAPEQSYDAFLAEAEDVPAGSEGLLFLPYLTGERTPHPDPNARGAFVGLTVRHEQAHLKRAILEGVAFGLRDSMELLQAQGAEIEQIRASGGGIQSPLWRQILADVMDCELVTMNTTEGAAYGAALLGGVGAGIWPDVETACDQVIEIADHIRPDPKTAKVYDALYPTYRGLYDALKTSFDALTTFSVD